MTRPNALGLMVGVLLVLAGAGFAETARAGKEHPEFTIKCKEKPEANKYCKIKGLKDEEPIGEQKPGELPPDTLTNIQWIAIADGDPRDGKHSHQPNPTPEQISEHMRVVHPGAPPYCHKWILLNGIWTQVHC